MVDDCVFCKIVAGEIPCHKIWEDEEFIAFLDVFPFVLGQVLVIPKEHVAPFVFDMEDEDYCKFMKVVKKVVLGVDKALKPTKTGMMIEGLDLDHVHAKVFPLSDAGFGAFSERIDKPGDEEMRDMADRIASEI